MVRVGPSNARVESANGQVQCSHARAPRPLLPLEQTLRLEDCLRGAGRGKRHPSHTSREASDGTTRRVREPSGESADRQGKAHAERPNNANNEGIPSCRIAAPGAILNESVPRSTQLRERAR